MFTKTEYFLYALMVIIILYMMVIVGLNRWSIRNIEHMLRTMYGRYLNDQVQKRLGEKNDNNV